MIFFKVFYLYITFINIISFFLMGYDKRQAIKNKWRIRERTFFIFSILGGSIGNLIGMYIFHHKTKHLSFKIGIPIILIFQIFILSFLYLN